MEILDIASVQPGRTLARAVYNKEGTLLFASGEKITEGVLKALKQRGIRTIAVGTAGGDASAASRQDAQPADVMESVRQMVAERFRLLDMDEPHTAAIFDLAVERQGRILLSRPGAITVGHRPTPAFQTQRPPKVDMGRLISSSQRMGTLPSVFQRLVEMINNPEVTAKELSTVISTDPALSARLLKLVNSPFYGVPYKVDTISRAVVLVGTRPLVMLAMGATLVTAFRGLPVSLVNMQSFWSHSISCGAAARVFAKHAGALEAEGFFTAGLLHDIARLQIYTQLPNHALYILTEAKRRQGSVHALELETLGFTHEALGGELLRAWNCPEDLVRRVAKHHEAITMESSVEDVILPAANTLTQALGYGSSGEICIPPLPGFVWDKLKISPQELLEQCSIVDENVRGLRSQFLS